MNCKYALVLIASVAALSAQTPPISILEVKVENVVNYIEDTPDVTKWGTVPIPVALPPFAAFSPTFKQQVQLGDVVSVNGYPMKGNFVGHARLLDATTVSNPGRVLLDFRGANMFRQAIALLLEDGTFVGTLLLDGTGTPLPTPGSPERVTGGSGSVTGGSGAFFGARGQSGTYRVSGVRGASITEDPAYRRVNGGGTITFVIQIIPAVWPEVLSLATGPAIFHPGDFSPVTADNPAKAGEQLILQATGLGPVSPRLDPGKPFPSYPQGTLHAINSPVQVTVNGRDALVVNKVGWPETVAVYRVDFIVPDNTPAGMATVTLGSAWIFGPEVRIPIR